DPSMVTWLGVPQDDLQSAKAWDDCGIARGTVYQQDLPSLWTSAQECGARASLSLLEMRVDLPSGWSGSYQHSCKVSWDIWEPPRSWRYGTAHQYEVCAPYWRSLWATTRSRWTLVLAECHVKDRFFLLWVALDA